MDEDVPAAYDSFLATLAGTLPPAPPRPAVKMHLLDLASAPEVPLNPSDFSWEEPFPGVKIAVVREDKDRQMCATLLWGTPGARFPMHRHGGEEAVLVLQGAYKDERGSYAAGNVTCSPAGSVHTVEILPEGDCISYIVSYGETQLL